MKKYRIELLHKSHNKAAFNSGEKALNTYLHKQATQDIKRSLSAVYVLLALGDSAVLGFYTLSASSIPLDDIPYEISKKLPRYPFIPVTLLGRLAVDKKFQKQGVGALLLVDALKRSQAFSTEIGSMAVVVDALDDDAINFYEKFGFIKLLDSNKQLFLTMDAIKKI